MPRLPIWFGGAALVSGGYYTFYYHFYIPRHTTRRECETALEAEKLQTQILLQRYALLRHTTDLLKSTNVTASSLSSSSHLQPHATNRQRLTFYCELQRLREAFYALPPRAQTESEKLSILRQLDELEMTYCTSLNFRDVSLTLRQVLTCQFCYSVYLCCFCLIDPVVRRMTKHMDAAEEARRWVLHTLSRSLLSFLDVPVELTWADKDAWTRALGNVNDDSMEPLWLAFCPLHWIEVVGFWACPKNPLLLSPRIQLLQPRSRGLRWKLQDPFVTISPFEMYWGEQWQQKHHEQRRQGVTTNVDEKSSYLKLSSLDLSKDEKDKKMEAEKDRRDSWVHSSFGYPVAMHASVDEREIAPRLLPVVTTGLPRLLYINDMVALPDVQLRPSQNEAFMRIQERQYPLHRRTPGNSHTQKSTTLREDERKGKKASETLAQLRGWHLRGGVPFWHRVAWGSTYGGESYLGNRAQRKLVFRIGRTCYSSELLAEQTELQQQLVEDTYVE